MSEKKPRYALVIEEAGRPQFYTTRTEVMKAALELARQRTNVPVYVMTVTHVDTVTVNVGEI